MNNRKVNIKDFREFEEVKVLCTRYRNGKNKKLAVVFTMDKSNQLKSNFEVLEDGKPILSTQVLQDAINLYNEPFLTKKLHGIK